MTGINSGRPGASSPRMRHGKPLLSPLTVLILAAVARAAITVPVKPISVRLTMITGGDVIGPVIAYTDDCIVVDFLGAPHAIPWAQIDVGSAYRSRRALLADERGGRARLTADDHFSLGVFALNRDHATLARQELEQAAELDPKYEQPVEALLAQYRAYRAQSDTGKIAKLPPAGREPPTSQPAGLLAALKGATADLGSGRRYTTPTPEQRQRILDVYRRFGKTVGRTLEYDLDLIETDHFLIWTDWAPSRRTSLGPWCEQMYRVLSEQFNVPADQNIFLAKCPIFCFRSKAHYYRFARLFDDYDAKGSLAYTRMDDTGHVHIVVYRHGDSVADYERVAAALMHEGTHAFLHRFRTNRVVTGWLTEGLANLEAEQILGDHCPFGETAQALAEVYVTKELPLTEVLGAGDKLPGHLYPLAHSLVGYLISLDRAAFALVIGDVKDGDTVGVALNRRYHGLTYQTLEDLWRGQIRDRMAEEAAAKPPKWDPIFVP